MTPSQKCPRTAFRLSVLVISLFLVALEVVRAARASFTIDEASTYLGYLSQNVLSLFTFNSGNNHFLNTLLAKIFCLVGGTSELALRLPNLLGYVAYLVFSFLIVDRFVKNKIMAGCGYALLAVNPYLFDFFSLCRGYGLSLGFLMASLFFFFLCLDDALLGRPEAYRHLRYSLVAAGLAVLAVYVLLYVFSSLIFFSFILWAILNRQGDRSPLIEKQAHRGSRKKTLLWLGIAGSAVVMNILVISQDLALVQNVFEPVSVWIPGLTQADSSQISLFRMDIESEERRIPYENDRWELAERIYFTAVKLSCPASLMSRIETINISIGQETYRFQSAGLKHLLTGSQKDPAVFTFPENVSLKRSVIPTYRSVINWKGDGIFFKALGSRALLVIGIAGLAILIALGVGRILKKLHILRWEQFRILAMASLALAAFVGYPIYILKRAGEFNYGGQAGFIHDTVLSLIYKSFYGKTYLANQELAVFVLICLSLLGFLPVLWIQARRNNLASVLPGLSVLTILSLIFIVSLSLRGLFHTAYLFQRTGLFLIPLVTLFLVFAVQDIGRLKRGLNAAATALLVIAAGLCLYHFSQTANTAMALDWRSDADTKRGLEDLRTFTGVSPSVRPRIRLGVGAGLNPSFQYYVQRQRPAWLFVRPAPPYEAFDFYYFDEHFDLSHLTSPRLILIKRYPISGNVLLGREGKRR